MKKEKQTYIGASHLKKMLCNLSNSLPAVITPDTATKNAFTVEYNLIRNKRKLMIFPNGMIKIRFKRITQIQNPIKYFCFLQYLLTKVIIITK